MNSNQLLAHPEQSLANHLAGVAQLAEIFADWLGASSHGKLAGLLHDLGKAESVFQGRMEAIKAGKNDPGGKEPHAHHGAALALAQDHWPVAFVVNGHHAGLHNRGDLAKRADYEQRARGCMQQLEREGFSHLRDEFGPILPKCFEVLGDDPQRQMMAVELFTRFLFSALVDADRLDTERSDPESLDAVHDRQAWRTFDAVKLSEQVNKFITGKHRDPATLAGREPDVQRVRDEVAGLCRVAANEARGLFSLTVPTGGGKTRQHSQVSPAGVRHRSGSGQCNGIAGRRVSPLNLDDSCSPVASTRSSPTSVGGKETVLPRQHAMYRSRRGRGLSRSLACVWAV